MKSIQPISMKSFSLLLKGGSDTNSVGSDVRVLVATYERTQIHLQYLQMRH